MVQARIRQRVKNSMQSGRATTGGWILEYVNHLPQRPDPLTGWAGSSETRGQVQMPFPTLEAAKAYAERHGFSYEVSGGGAAPSLKLQAYADNFKGPDLQL
jgi:hypothetical protein